MTDAPEELPWFPLWVDDFLTSRKVRTMTPEQVGIYILLLINQWKDGPLPDDPDSLSMIANGADANAVGTVLERCFTSVASTWVNKRLEEVRQEQLEKRMQKVRAGKASAKARRRKRLQKSTPLEQRSNAVATPLEQPEVEVDREEEVTTTTPLGASADAPDEGGSKKKDPDPWPPKPPKGDSGNYLYPQPFEDAWEFYPKRDGSNPKLGAYRAFRARVKDGNDPADLVTAAKHYREHVQVRDREGTPYVQQTSTFYGPSEPFREFIDGPGEKPAPENTARREDGGTVTGGYVSRENYTPVIVDRCAPDPDSVRDTEATNLNAEKVHRMMKRLAKNKELSA